mmetsp:Transcript_4315/g.13845  ORF Transcript_4315/g.13845 Transcript_4315/m.13845 type:complete len:149 (+) Transcript_4315:61-507(+)
MHMQVVPRADGEAGRAEPLDTSSLGAFLLGLLSPASPPMPMCSAKKEPEFAVPGLQRHEAGRLVAPKPMILFEHSRAALSTLAEEAKQLVQRTARCSDTEEDEPGRREVGLNGGSRCPSSTQLDSEEWDRCSDAVSESSDWELVGRSG